MARAKGILLGKVVNVPPEAETISLAEKLMLATRNANNAASFEDLLLPINEDGEQASGQVAFNIVCGANTSNLGGIGGMMPLSHDRKRLSDKYESKSAAPITTYTEK